MVKVNEASKGERKPENKMEAVAEPTWMTEEEIMKGEDWKAIVIIQKAKTKGIL